MNRKEAFAIGFVTLASLVVGAFATTSPSSSLTSTTTSVDINALNFQAITEICNSASAGPCSPVSGGIAVGI